MKNSLQGLIITVVLFHFSVINAQMIYMPDSALRVKLAAQGFGACIVSDSINSSCSAVISTTMLTLSGSSIHDLTGINAFINLQQLYCDANFISFLPALPSSLLTLKCQVNSIDSIQNLPSSITTLNCQNNSLLSIGILPASLYDFNCSSNQLQALPALPAGLAILDCSSNNLNSLPNLPVTLQSLQCMSNNLTSLPSLPGNLYSLNCSWNHIQGFISVPSSLAYLYCNNNNISSLSLGGANSLMYIHCSFNNITYIANMSSLNNVREFDCSYNANLSLGGLPVHLKYFHCRGCNLSSLPYPYPASYPDSLEDFDCSNNQFTVLASLPGSIINFKADSNLLTINPAVNNFLTSYPWRNYSVAHNLIDSLVSFPSGFPSFQFIDLSYNLIDTIRPNISLTAGTLSLAHNNLRYLQGLAAGTLYCNDNALLQIFNLNYSSKLYASNNQLTGIPTPWTGMTDLDVSHNNILSLPELPDSLHTLLCNSNPALTCLPRLKNKLTTLRFDSTAINCIPNYINASSTPALGSIPLCNEFNSNGCPFYWNVNGRAYLDTDSNCIFSLSENGIRNVHIKFLRGTNVIMHAYTGPEGLFSFDEDTFGVYTSLIDTSGIAFTSVCPVSNSYSDTLNAADSTEYNNDFALNCKNGFDIGVWSIYSTQPRPGNYAIAAVHAGDFALFNNMHCASGVSGDITVIINGAAAYSAPAPNSILPSSVSGDTITYHISDFGTIADNFSFIISVDTNAAMGSQICINSTAALLSGDYNQSNNNLTNCFTVVSSYDPNDKQVYPAGIIDTAAGYLTYTIRFQNTGTAPAEDILVIDTLSNYLDISTFELLSTSHPAFVQIVSPRIARFSFSNINLPDSNSNEPLSHGYIQYRIKYFNNLSSGVSIDNKAYIYFDFNTAVLTNTIQNFVNFNSSITNIDLNSNVNVYPNPFSKNITVDISGLKVRINYKLYNTIGIQLCTGSFIQKTNIDLSELSDGIYFIEFESSNTRICRKIVKY